jgi:diaminohydroxyphosphoribosylaminopyrimidine deaminase/5-amino-6-(5-phosphoribosylamino)uracil reductase
MTQVSQLYEHWMELALQAAARGRGSVEPNPLVGAVVVDAAGEVVAVGGHERFGGPHAEVVALQQAGERARGGTLVVTLEPCCHYGKTPPCTEAILAAGIRTVVAAHLDPFPAVSGRGVQRLQQAGVEVIVGVGQRAAHRLNAAYLKRVTMGQPWVHVKWAMSLDGRIALPNGAARWISGAVSRQRVHQWRGLMDAIVVGAGTVRADDPRLTVRPPGRRTPWRVVVSARGELPDDCYLLRTAREVPTLLYTSTHAIPRLQRWQQAGVQLVALPSHSSTLLDLHALLGDLAQRGCTHVLVEGGAGLLSSFWRAQAIDEWHVFIAPVLLADGIPPLQANAPPHMAQALRLVDVSVECCQGDAYLHGYTPRGPYAPDVATVPDDTQPSTLPDDT